MISTATLFLRKFPLKSFAYDSKHGWVSFGKKAGAECDLAVVGITGQLGASNGVSINDIEARLVPLPVEKLKQLLKTAKSTRTGIDERAKKLIEKHYQLHASSRSRKAPGRCDIQRDLYFTRRNYLPEIYKRLIVKARRRKVASRSPLAALSTKARSLTASGTRFHSRKREFVNNCWATEGVVLKVGSLTPDKFVETFQVQINGFYEEFPQFTEQSIEFSIRERVETQRAATKSQKKN